ncbi:VOC family protein [Hymenobacter seoulensis]
MVPKLRVARPTNNLQALLRFYRDGLGLTVLGSFTNHDGFDGLMLGHPQAPYHLEFTSQRGYTAVGVPSAEHLLVFYVPDADEWLLAVNRMREAGFESVSAHNPYWNQHGVTFTDPDGYRVVLQQAAWDF